MGQQPAAHTDSEGLGDGFHHDQGGEGVKGDVEVGHWWPSSSVTMARNLARTLIRFRRIASFVKLIASVGTCGTT
ncbi:MAG: hypothetical protein ACK559_37685 [bacterium]